jgi:hypothetical protein
MKKQNAAIAARLRNVDANRGDSVGFERAYLCAFGWPWNERLNPTQLFADLCGRLQLTAPPSIHEPQRNAQKLTVPTDPSRW